MFNLRKNYREGKISKPEYISKMYEFHQYLHQYAKLLPETNIKKIVIDDNNVYMETRDMGIKLVCKEMDERIVPIETLNFGYYEKEELEIICDILESIDATTYWDIGANVGYISMYVGKKRPQMKIQAFEPLLPTYEMLETNLYINNMKNIITHNVGLAEEQGEFPFYYYPAGCGNSSLENLSERGDVKKIVCKVETVDDIYNKLKEKTIDFIKCDVEGAEFSVLKGGMKTISETKPILFLELLRKWSKKFGYTPNDVISYLKPVGYQCYIIKDGKLEEIAEVTENTVETNFLFLHKEKHRNVLKRLS